ncbi:Hypothetical protein LUCI_4407 [Lucifera butyrica]|uniref:DUF1254 domain-containing protein n=1 Tax=Lucifera butyrica TaxID=1351585 RepID=A0A498RCI3_9FIRM|nr:DUF1254 domain-containing protein [Lucifera butyrica]VBB09121.1 Hypothetical protein LUCI_4407 [Lucifera butyrica]
MEEDWRADFYSTKKPDSVYGRQNPLNLLAIDAYIYGYPLVLTDTTRRIMLAGGMSLNQFLNEPVFPSPRYTTIVRPNVDTLYSMAWLDLSREPVILYLPDTYNIYYLMELLDAWTNVFASLGTRTTGTKAGVFAITGPDWNGMLPEGFIRIGAPANTVWIIGRTQTNGPEDYPIVHAIQNSYALIPLSCWGKFDIPKIGAAKQVMNIDPSTQVANMNAAVFFQTMMAAMHRNPPWIQDPAMSKKLAALGLIPGKTFNFYSLSPSVQLALELAIDHGSNLLQAAASKKYFKNSVHGWTLLVKDIGFYGADYMQRALIAMTGIGANLPQDSVYGPAFIAADGMPLSGYNNYIIHFEQQQLPPVNAFWSITVYNDKGFLVENPIDRYAISPHLGRLNYNADGSLTIFVQNTSPGKDLAANWLPAPKGPFNLLLRLYWPKGAVLRGNWTPPAILRMQALS